jgi:hypothetical protein
MGSRLLVVAAKDLRDTITPGRTAWAAYFDFGFVRLVCYGFDFTGCWFDVRLHGVEFFGLSDLDRGNFGLRRLGDYGLGSRRQTGCLSGGGLWEIRYRFGSDVVGKFGLRRLGLS